LRHRQRHAGLARVAQDELARLDRRSLAGTLPSRVPTRPALSTGGGSFADASDASLLRTRSSAVLPISGASANSSRSWLSFSSTVLSCSGAVAVDVSVVMSVVSLRFS
jgi:hypothetical protein